MKHTHTQKNTNWKQELKFAVLQTLSISTNSTFHSRVDDANKEAESLRLQFSCTPILLISTVKRFQFQCKHLKTFYLTGLKLNADFYESRISLDVACFTANNGNK